MAAITRTVTTFEVKAYVLDDATPPQVSEYARIALVDTSMNDRKARIGFRDAGVALPKGCTLKWTVGEEVTYSMDIDKFMANADVL